jgi:hypothetical protein
MNIPHAREPVPGGSRNFLRPTPRQYFERFLGIFLCWTWARFCCALCLAALGCGFIWFGCELKWIGEEGADRLYNAAVNNGVLLSWFFAKAPRFCWVSKNPAMPEG